MRVELLPGAGTAIAAAGAAIVVLLSAHTASAYCRTTTATPALQPCPARCVTSGVPFYWPTHEVSYVLNERGFPDLDDASLRAALARSFTRWQAASCADGQTLTLTITQEPGTTPLQAGPRSDEPNDNTISFLSGDEWQSAEYDDSAFAFTFMWFDPRNGQIRGSDLLFNGGKGRFAVCPDGGCPPGVVDLENVATHEAGHLLGLSHSQERDTTMWCGAEIAEVSKRKLSADDVAGICAIYAEREVERRDADLRAARDDGCSTLPGGHQRGAAGAALLWALAWLAKRRARRRAQ